MLHVHLPYDLSFYFTAALILLNFHNTLLGCLTCVIAIALATKLVKLSVRAKEMLIKPYSNGGRRCICWEAAMLVAWPSPLWLLAAGSYQGHMAATVQGVGRAENQHHVSLFLAGEAIAEDSGDSGRTRLRCRGPLRLRKPHNAGCFNDRWAGRGPTLRRAAGRTAYPRTTLAGCRVAQPTPLTPARAGRAFRAVRRCMDHVIWMRSERSHNQCCSMQVLHGGLARVPRPVHEQGWRTHCT